jgi:hypothetical protein
MPRQNNQSSATGIYHVTMRGINHQNIFEEKEDYYQFLNTVLIELKGKRASLRQLERLTGIGKNMIYRMR